MEATKKSSVVNRWLVAIKPVKRNTKSICNGNDTTAECAFKQHLAVMAEQTNRVFATYRPSCSTAAISLQL